MCKLIINRLIRHCLCNYRSSSLFFPIKDRTSNAIGWFCIQYKGQHFPRIPGPDKMSEPTRLQILRNVFESTSTKQRWTKVLRRVSFYPASIVSGKFKTGWKFVHLGIKRTWWPWPFLILYLSSLRAQYEDIKIEI